METAQRYRTQ